MERMGNLLNIILCERAVNQGECVKCNFGVYFEVIGVRVGPMANLAEEEEIVGPLLHVAQKQGGLSPEFDKL